MPIGNRWADIAGAGLVLSLLAVMIVPVATPLIDLLLIMNIALGLIVLLTTMYVRQPLQFSVFPTLLLIATLFRLALNVASTRAILLGGYGGRVIEAFGSFVVGGNTAVGLVAFFILAVIQFVVITKGAGRIAEVVARFTLDAMPGRQMAIDADLNAGVIDEFEARRRREEVNRLADFYGAMDGASKFVRGDAIAGIVITLINIVGGLAVGMLQMNMSLTDAVRTFTLLTVGDGLVAQIPALVVSTASGILITRAQDESNLSQQISEQLGSEPRVFTIAAAMLGILGLVPGLPFLPFWVLGGILYGLGRLSSRRQSRRETEAEEREVAARPPERVETHLRVDAMEIEVGYALINLVEEAKGGDLTDRVTIVRRQLATELGIVMPPVRIRDNVQLKPDTYTVKIRGMEVARGRLLRDHWLAMNPGDIKDKVRGIETTDPVFGLPSVWVDEAEKPRAEQAGYTVVEPAAIIATHLSEVARRHGSTLLGRQEVKSLLDHAKPDFGVVIDELVPNVMSLGDLQKVLSRLLRERVSIRDVGTILEALADHAPATKSPLVLTEKVRQALGRAVALPYVDEKGTLQAVTLDLELERVLLSAVQQDDGEPRLVLAPDTTERFLDRMGEAIRAVAPITEVPVFICTQGVRPHVYDLASRVFPSIVVVSYQEIEGLDRIRSIQSVSLVDAPEPTAGPDPSLANA